MFIDEDRKFLVAARRRKGSASSHYDVATSQSAGVGARCAPGFVGKLRANFIGTEFVLFDGGSKAGAQQQATAVGGGPAAAPRRELAAITYEPNILGTKGPRKMLVALPAAAKQQQLHERASRGRLTLQHVDSNGAGGGGGGAGARIDEPSLLERLKAAPQPDGGSGSGAGAGGGLVILRNKHPRWNELMKAFCLNFGGRVTVASVKNFQLVAHDDPETVLLQFGKVGDETFTCDFRWPLTALQAFAICLSSFDSKLACE
jgi:tubby-related protein 1